MEDIVRYWVVPLVAALVGGTVVHVLTLRRDLGNDRRRQRIDYLLASYRTIAASAHRELESESAGTFEDALSDVVLLGTQDQISLARQVIAALASSRSAKVDELLLSLRSVLRADLGLDPDGLSAVPVLRIRWAPEARPALLATDAVQYVDFAEGLREVREGLPPRMETRSVGPTLRSETSPELAQLRSTAVQGPGLAVVEAYRLLGETMASLLGLASGDALDLAQRAAREDTLSAGTARSVEGLKVLMHVAQDGGSGTGLTPQKALDYLAVVEAVLFAIEGELASSH